jgi:hypothetical protein
MMGECFNLPRLHCIYEQSKPEWITPPSSCTCWALVMRYSYWCSIQHEPRDILNRVNLLSQVLNRFLKSNIWSNMQILSHTELQAITYWTSSWTFEKMTWAYTVRSVLLKIVLCMMGVLVQGWHSANGNSCRGSKKLCTFRVSWCNKTQRSWKICSNSPNCICGSHRNSPDIR